MWRAPMKRVRLVVFNAALGPLDYRVPEGMPVEAGSVVVAPLGPRKIIGIVWEPGRLLATGWPRPSCGPCSNAAGAAGGRADSAA